MFKWILENMDLLNEHYNIYIGNEKIYNCECKTSRQDKIDFVDSMQDGKLSYILSLIDKFNLDRNSLPKDRYEVVKTTSLKGWIKKNDNRSVIDNSFHYGEYRLLNCERYITAEYEKNDYKGKYDTYINYVDECFHRQLKECERKEREYFLEHDEYSILKKTFLHKNRNYGTTFGVNISICSNGEIYVYKKSENEKKKEREISIDELKYLLLKYEKLDDLIEKITEETNIEY